MTDQRDSLGVLANFKTPSLRNVALTAPYMHAGQFATLEEVVDHYARAPEVPFPEHTDIQPAPFDERDRAHLVAFLATLTSPIDDPLGREGERDGKDDGEDEAASAMALRPARTGR